MKLSGQRPDSSPSHGPPRHGRQASRPLPLAKHDKEDNTHNHSKRQQSERRQPDATDNRPSLRISSCRDLSASDVYLAATVLANVSTFKPLSPGLCERRLNRRERLVAVRADLAARHHENGNEQPCQKPKDEREQRDPQVHVEPLRVRLQICVAAPLAPASIPAAPPPVKRPLKPPSAACPLTPLDNCTTNVIIQ
jgi:hypothetical protein